MADNVDITQGTGTTIAADEISGVKFQRIKLTIGADGVNDGDISAANPMPVSVASVALPTGASTAAKQDTGNTSLASIDGKIVAVNTGAVTVAASALPTGASTAAKQPALGVAGTPSADVISVQGAASMTPLLVDASATTQPVSGTVTANAGTNLNTSLLALEAGGNLAAISASASVLDDWDESDRAKVNPIVGSAGVAGGSGVVGATTQRVTLATDVALPTGTNSIGQVTANAGTNLNTSLLALEAGGNLALIAASASVLDDWDESDRAKANIIVGQAGVTGGAGNTDAATQRVVIATNQATVPVSQNASTVPAATTMQSAATANGNGTSLNVQGFATAILDIVSSPSMSGGTTINFEISPDDTTWVAVLAHMMGAAGVLGSTTTADGEFRINCAGFKSIRARISAYSAGTITVKGYATVVAGAGTTVALSASTAAIGSVIAAGDVANAASDSGNPVKIGGIAKTANPTAVTDGQRVNALHDKLGKAVVVGSIRDLKVVQQTTITSSTAETTVVTAVASTFLDVYGVIITNTSATVTKVTFKDSTAGTTRFVFEIPATDSRGFMLPESGAVPQATVNNNWTATCGTSVSAIEITMLAVKNT